MIIAGDYADKLRRTLFAQLKYWIKSGEISNQEVARDVGEINRVLYEIVVKKLGVDKGDVIRARVEYDVVGGVIHWKLDTLKIEVFRRVKDEEVSKAVKQVVERMSEGMAYSVEKVGEKTFGDEVYRVLEDDNEIGKIIVTKINNAVLVEGALKIPPRIIEKTKPPI